ncbi:MAG: hypothetical protein ACPHQP_07460 [Longimicrobiales bacterium]
MRHRRCNHATLFLLALFLTACGGGPTVASGPAPATDAEWRTLGTPRPDPLPGAARVTISSFEVAGASPWRHEGPVDATLAVAELATAGLLQRRDVHFVERRRFSAAAAAERAGLPRPPGRPPVGVSVGAEFGVTAVYIPISQDLASLEVRLTDLESGDVAGTTRLQVSAGGDPVEMGRSMVSGILEVLDELDRRPTWDDHDANVGSSDRVAPTAIANFLRGLAFEDVWRWEDARVAYQAALEGDFPEARAALARTARLRLGGTLAES